MDIVFKEYDAIKTGQYVENIPGNYSYVTRDVYYSVNRRLVPAI